MSHVEFRPIDWMEISGFLAREGLKPNRDIDSDVRYLPFTLFAEQFVEGLYLDGVLVGFARWDIRTKHLSNLYVMQEARGKGLARKYMTERGFKSLYVMPGNEVAKRLYTSLGFEQRPSAFASREYMVRPAAPRPEAA